MLNIHRESIRRTALSACQWTVSCTHMMPCDFPGQTHLGSGFPSQRGLFRNTGRAAVRHMSDLPPRGLRESIERNARGFRPEFGVGVPALALVGGGPPGGIGRAPAAGAAAGD